MERVAALSRYQWEKLGYRECGVADNAPDAVAGIENSKPDIALIYIEIHGNRSDAGDFLVSKTDIPFESVTAQDDPEILEKERKTIPDGFFRNPMTSASSSLSLKRHKEPPREDTRH